MFILHCVNEVVESGQSVTITDKSYAEWVPDESDENEVTRGVFFGENIRRAIKTLSPHKV